MQNRKILLMTLILVLFLDGLGQGVIYPVLGEALLAVGHANLFIPHASFLARNMVFGSALAVFFICWFFGAAILGDISDNVGRKKALMITLSGMALGNLVSAFAFTWHSLLLIYLGRIIVGFTAGSQAIAQAAITDIGRPEEQAKLTGWVLFGVTIGLVMGPAIGGLLSNADIVSWFSPETPLYFTTILAVLNIVLLVWVFKETRPNLHPHKIRISRAITIFVQAWKVPKVRDLVWIFFLLQMGWTIFYMDLPLHMLSEFGGGSNTIAIFMTVMGVGLSVGCALLPQWAERVLRYPIRVTFWGYLILAVLFILVLVVPGFWTKCFLAFIATTAMAAGYVLMVKTLSSQASEDQQGWIMGVQNATMVLSIAVAMLWGGYLMGVSHIDAFVIAIAVLVVGLIAVFLKRHHYQC